MKFLGISTIVAGLLILLALGLYVMGPIIRLASDDDLVGGKRGFVKQVVWWRIGAFAVFTVFLVLVFSSTANAQSRDLTGGEMLQHYQAGGVSKDTVSMYVMGVVDGMGMSGAICVPQDKPKGDYVQQVVYNLGANTQLHERRFDIAVSSAAIMAYPCGDPA